MKTSATYMLTLITMMNATAASGAGLIGNNNVIITECTDIYRLKANDGRLGSVKNIETTVYTATRADAHAAAYAPYTDHITIDKASAPGAKPVYRHVLDDDVFYSDSRICFMDVPVKQGKDVKVTFERTFRSPEQFCTVPLTTVYDARKIETIVIVPQELAASIEIEPVNLPASAQFSRNVTGGGAVEYTVTLTDCPAWRPEPGAPSRLNDAPYLKIRGVFGDLQQLYSYLRGFLEDDPASPELTELAQRLTDGAPCQEAAVDSIAAWVRQNIRYIAVEHGEYGIRPDTAAAVLRKRYGDCKGSANLIRGLLRKAGIDGRMVWIGTAGDIPFDWAEFPSLASGNHAIAAAMLPDTVIYIDGTAAYAPHGYIPPTLRGRPALIENGDTYIYARVPDACADADRTTVTAGYTLGEDGRLTGTESRSYSGYKRMGLLDSYWSTDTRGREKLLRSLILNGLKEGTVTDVALTTEGLNADDAAVSASVDLPGMVKKTGKAYYIDMRMLSGVVATVDAESRRRGLGSRFPSVIEVDKTLIVPEGYEVKLPDCAEWSGRWFVGSADYSYDPDTRRISCRARLRLTGEACGRDQLDEYNAAAAAINRAASRMIVIRPAEQESKSDPI